MIPDKPAVRELQIPENSSKVIIAIADAYPAEFDVSSIRISIDKVESVELSVGGNPMLTFTSQALRSLPVEDGHVQILQPFIRRLPLTRVKYNEFNITVKPLPGTLLPGSTIKLDQQHGFAGEYVLPMLQPQPTFHADTCLRTEGGIAVAPNALTTGQGMAALALMYDHGSFLQGY